ncbi:hypothetical protein BBP40_000565 [Aspergillus hancockii]|nr:hypothetical protein BBP40_000565 [Aspergillus hancockii]
MDQVLTSCQMFGHKKDIPPTVSENGVVHAGIHPGNWHWNEAFGVVIAGAPKFNLTRNGFVYVEARAALKFYPKGSTDTTQIGNHFINPINTKINAQIKTFKAAEPLNSLLMSHSTRHKAQEQYRQEY